MLDVLIEEFDGSQWVATLREGRLEGLEIDPAQEEVRWGSIYNARVMKIDKALDAAILDLDGENQGLIFNRDVHIRNKDGTIRKGGDVAIGKILSPGQIIPVQAKAGYLPQVTDDYAGLEDKAPRMSMNITLPGRFLIFDPLAQAPVISRRIRDKKLRDQLIRMLETTEECKGCILRAAAAHIQTDMLRREARILRSIWDQLQAFFGNEEEIGLIMAGPDAVQRTLADQATHLIDRIEVIAMDHFQSVEEWCELYAPDLVTKIQPVEMKKQLNLGLFELRDIVGQIEGLVQPYALLKDGSSLIIQETAALTAIDVNRGGARTSALAVNIEAANEAARQLRLRNIGGIVIVDFLRLTSPAEQQKLLDALQNAVDDDPCTVQIHGFTNLGLVELTRKRRTPPLADKMQSMFGEE